MKQYIFAFTSAIAVAFAFLTTSAYALDLPGAGETYTVPANTTNVVEEADMAAYNALGKVVFTDETSALRFNTATAPNVLLEGAGWMIKDGNETWDISKQQTTAWVGTWDFRGGETKLTATEGGNHSHLFAYSCPYIHDVYVRSGAYVHFASGWKTCQAYRSCRFHMAGRFDTSAGGYGPTIRQMVLDGDVDWHNGTSTTPTFSYSDNDASWLDLNGYNMIVDGDNYAQNSFYFQGSTIKGPGSLLLNQYVCGGMIIRSYSYSNYDGWLCLDGGAVVTGNVRVAATVYDTNPTSDYSGKNIKYGIVRHKDATFVTGTRVAWFGKYGGIPAYFLEGGLLECPNGMVMINANPDDVVNSASYMHFRQTGGDFKTTGLAITNYTDGVGLMADIAFGGSGTVKIGSGGMHLNGDAAFSFSDNVKFSVEDGIGNSLGGHHIWAYNGGTAESRFLATDGFSRPDGDFFAFDGGAIAYGHTSNGTSSDLFGSNPEIRVYERGGGVAVTGTRKVEIDGVDFFEPKGNVLKSVALPDNTKFRSVPRVEIVDAGGTGSNAVAVVDYDFDSRKVTNITILCRGEGYSSSANVKANLWELNIYTNQPRVANFACTVGPEESGDFTFSATNLGGQVWIMAHTNYTHGSIIVDMDPLGLVDGGFVDKSKYQYTGSGQDGFENTLVIKYYATNLPIPRFENCTNIIVKSGGMHLWSSWGYNHDYLLPKCYSLEIYGGHIGGGTLAVTNLVIGGTAFLSGHNYMRSWGVGNGSSPYSTDLNVYGGTPKNPNIWRTMYSVCSTPGTVTIDVDSPNGPAVLKGGCTPSIDANDDHSQFVGGGSFRFGGSPTKPSTMTIKNYESLRKTKGRRTLLDLSDPNLVVAGTNNVNVVTPPDIANFGKLKWSPVQRKLYWMPDGGMYLIFK